ncbi:MAG: hypothetical protein PF961_16015 [Planctomycetota bacterium]|jgi:hypothetical protein|nr:hypothetical protein [Planctomycetota bacterium]
MNDTVISSLVVTVTQGHDPAALCALLSADPRLTVGETDGARVAVVSEDLDQEAAEATFRELQSHRMIDYVDLVAVYLDPDQGDPCEGR